MSLKHDLLHHPFKRRRIYEIHKPDAVFQGFTDETLVYTYKSACSEGKVVAGMIVAVKLKAHLKGDTDGDAVIIAREKDGEVRPITAVLKNGKGKKQRAQRIIKQIKKIADEYTKKRGAKVTYMEG